MTLPAVASALEFAVRILAITAVSAAGLVALVHWGVRAGHLRAFAPLPMSVRRLSDPLLQPVERRLVRSGRNPQDAVWWLLGGTLVGALLVLSGTRWLLGGLVGLGALGGATPRIWLRLAVGGLFNLVIIAIVIRVIGTWVGLNPYAGWMRPVRLLSDWILNPIRRFMPPFGALDLSPLIAYFVVIILRGLVLGFL